MSDTTMLMVTALDKTKPRCFLTDSWWPCRRSPPPPPTPLKQQPAHLPTFMANLPHPPLCLQCFTAWYTRRIRSCSQDQGDVGWGAGALHRPRCKHHAFRTLTAVPHPPDPLHSVLQKGEVRKEINKLQDELAGLERQDRLAEQRRKAKEDDLRAKRENERCRCLLALGKCLPMPRRVLQ